MKKNVFSSMVFMLAFMLTLGASKSFAQSYTVTVKLLDSYGSGLPDGEVRYYDGGWQLLGITGPDGTVSGTVPKHPNSNTRDFEMKYEAGRDLSQKAVDITTNPTLTYQTVPLTIKLETCDGTPLVGTAMQHDVGGWKDIGPTPATKELLPGTNYAIGMKFENRTDNTTFNSVNPATTPEVVFKTTKITFNYSGTVFWYNKGWTTFTSPKEVLGGIGSADFKFGDTHNPTFSLDITGCTMEKSAVTIKLLDSNGDGLEGGIAKYKLGSWQTAGTTNSDGEVFALIDGLQNTLAFRMYWEGTYIGKNQNISTNSTVVFHTVLAKMELHASDGTTQLTGEGKVLSGVWKTLGDTPTISNNGGMELLPKTYAFRIYYEGTYIQKDQNVTSNQLVTFETVLVQMELKSSLGTQLVGEGKVNSGSWKSLGNTPTISNNGGMELLPKTYAFRIYYEGTYIGKNQNISTNSTVVFQTVFAKMELHASDGTTQLTGGGKVNSGTWKSLGNTPTTGMELLPQNYAFRIYYEGTYIGKNQNISTNSTVVFQTVLAKMELHASDGTTQLSGQGKVDSGGWKTLGNTPTNGMELLPKTYAFRIYYEGTYIGKNQNITSNQLVVFQTVLVQMELHASDGSQLTGEGRVNSGSWKSLGNTPTISNNGGMELLPKTYAFRIYYEGTYIGKNQNVTSNHLVTFETVFVPIEDPAPKEMKEDVLTDLIALLPSGDKKTDDRLKKAIKAIDKSLDDKLWEDGNYLTKKGKKVFDEEKKAVKELNKIVKEKKNKPLKTEALEAILKLVAIDESLAQKLIDKAEDGGDSKEIEKAEKEMEKAQKEFDKGKYDKAIDHYKKAWGHAYHALKKVGALGKYSTATDELAVTTTPETFSLSENYPNPFNPITTINYQLPEASQVTMTVYDLMGRKVKTLVQEFQSAGNHSVLWNATNDNGTHMSGGMYFYQIRAGSFQQTHKMILLK